MIYGGTLCRKTIAAWMRKRIQDLSPVNYCWISKWINTINILILPRTITTNEVWKCTVVERSIKMWWLFKTVTMDQCCLYMIVLLLWQILSLTFFHKMTELIHSTFEKSLNTSTVQLPSSAPIFPGVTFEQFWANIVHRTNHKFHDSIYLRATNESQSIAVVNSLSAWWVKTFYIHNSNGSMTHHNWTAFDYPKIESYPDVSIALEATEEICW